MSKKHKDHDKKHDMQHHHEHGEHCHHDDEVVEFGNFDDFDDMDMGGTDETLINMTSILVDSISHLTELCVDTELHSGNKLVTKDVLKIYDQVSEKVFANMQKMH